MLFILFSSLKSVTYSWGRTAEISIGKHLPYKDFHFLVGEKAWFKLSGRWRCVSEQAETKKKSNEFPLNLLERRIGLWLLDFQRELALRMLEALTQVNWITQHFTSCTAFSLANILSYLSWEVQMKASHKYAQTLHSFLVKATEAFYSFKHMKPVIVSYWIFLPYFIQKRLLLDYNKIAFNFTQVFQLCWRGYKKKVNIAHVMLLCYPKNYFKRSSICIEWCFWRSKLIWGSYAL